ncbi:MAG TPA: hypothetical protein ENN60_02120 [archaeon]|nr:hypothetical protein [archaeon]
MKGIDQQIIPLVLGVIIAGALLIVGFTVISQAKGGIEDLQSTSEQFQQRLEAMDNLYLACRDWTTGDRYNAEKILNTYKLPDRMQPYRYPRTRCGEPLKELAQKCYRGTETYGGCAGNGYISAGETEVSTCTTVCRNVQIIYEKCEVACNNNVVSCFEYLIESQGSSISSDSMSVPTNLLNRACGG